jgi:acetyl esterase/lipase
MLTLDPALFRPEAVSPETAAFNAALEAQLRDLPSTHEVPVAITRKARDEGRGIFPPGGPLPGSDWVAIPGGRRVRITPAPGAPRGVYIHIHGGAWALGSPMHYDRINQELARETGMVVVSVQYRLAPEHVWPAHREDTVAGAEWAMAGFPGLPVVIGGESAGAHLAAVTLLALRERGGLARIAGAVLNYGAYDLRLSGLGRRWGARKLILSTPMLEWAAAGFVPDKAMREDPAVSPLLADLTGLPPALFQVGTADPLLDDSLMMAALWAAGRHAELAVWPGGVHAFDMFDLQIARDFRARQIAFMQGCLGAG